MSVNITSYQYNCWKNIPWTPEPWNYSSFYQFHAQKALFKAPKICNRNFWHFSKNSSDLVEGSFPKGGGGGSGLSGCCSLKGTFFASLPKRGSDLLICLTKSSHYIMVWRNFVFPLQTSLLLGRLSQHQNRYGWKTPANWDTVSPLSAEIFVYVVEGKRNIFHWH